MNPEHPPSPDTSDRIPAPPLDQFNFALEEIADQSMRFVIEFDGQLDADRLGRACLAAIHQAPVLGCRFVEAESPYWERIPHMSAADILDVIASRDPDQDLMDALAAHIDPATGPQVHLRLLRREDDTLCITAHHAVMDAHGLFAFVTLLASLYRNDRIFPGGSLRDHDRSLAPILSRIPSGVHETVHAYNEKLVAGWKFPATMRDAAGKKFAIRTLEPARLPATKTKGKELGATVNDILLAAFFSALRDFVHPKAGTIVPVLLSLDLRMHFPEKECMSLSSGDPDSPFALQSLAGAIANKSVAFQVMVPVQDRTFDETVVVMKELMREHKDHYPGLSSAIDTESAGYTNYSRIRERVRTMKESYASTGSEPPFLGNIGIIRPEVCAFSPDLPVKNAFIAGIIVNPPGIALGVTTFRDRLTLSIGYKTPAMAEETVERFLDRITGYLPGK